MKTIIFSMILACISIFQNSFAASTNFETTTFKVSGNCGMCKNKIESALKANASVQSADWDATSKVVTVVYNSNQTSVDQLQQLVADAGYSTEKIKTTDAAYKSLPKCCQYNNESNPCCKKKCCKKKACATDCCTAECAPDKACTTECCKAACCK